MCVEKGGRIGNATRFIGALLDLKPLVEINPQTGLVEGADRVCTRRKGIEALYQRFFEKLDAAVAACRRAARRVPEDAALLAERIRQEYRPAELLINITRRTVMHVKVDQETQEYIRQAQLAKSEIITEADLAPLPGPVQRYLRFAQVIGKPRVKCVKVRQTGLMRTRPTQKWMPVEAVQYSTLAGPLSRMWYARIKLGPLALLSGHDSYDNGTGHMLIRLLSMFPVVNIRGAEIDLSALIIFINDMVMWPTAFLSDYIQWEPIDARSACARVNLHGQQFSAVLYFNDLGEMVDFVTEDRYSTVGKRFERTKWSTPLRHYRKAHGLRIPSEGDAIWHLPEGEFPYIKATIGEIQYDTFDYD